MKRAILSLAVTVVLIGLSGCIHQHGRRPWARLGGSCAQTPETAAPCDGGCESEMCEETASCSARRSHWFKQCPEKRCVEGQGAECQQACPPAAGPATGAVTYPYYTIRGPRDFLAKNPPSIGP